MKTGQWTYTLTPEKEIWNTGAFFDTREQCIEEGIKAAKEQGDIKKIAISEIEVHQLALSISVENIIDEIAEELGITINTIRTQVSRGYKKLRDILSEEVDSSVLFFILLLLPSIYVLYTIVMICAYVHLDYFNICLTKRHI